MFSVSQQTLQILADVLVANVDLVIPVDRISLSEDRGMYGDTVVDEKALAPNPDHNHQFEFCKILEQPDFVEDYVKVAFADTTATVEWWNIKPFKYISPYSAFIDKALLMPRQFIEQVLISAPEFVADLDDITSQQELTKKLIHPTLGLDNAMMSTILKRLSETGEFAATRQLAITSVFKQLLKTLSDESITALYEKLIDLLPSAWGPMSDVDSMRTHLLIARDDRIIEPDSLLAFKPVSEMTFELRTAKNAWGIFSVGEYIHPGMKVVDMIYTTTLGVVYITEIRSGIIEGTVLPLLTEASPRLHDSPYKWWDTLTPGNIVCHYRYDAVDSGTRTPYGIVDSEADEHGRVTVQWSNASIDVPSHLLDEIAPTALTYPGKSYDDLSELQFLDTVSVEGSEPWTVQGFDGSRAIVYLGPRGYITKKDDTVIRIDTRIEYDLMDYVLLQHEPQEPRSRFIVIGRRFFAGQKTDEYCCRPLTSATDVRGCVWLPETSIYHVDLWFNELGIFDPVPVTINYPKPPLRIDTTIYKSISGKKWTTGGTAREEVPLLRRTPDTGPFLETVHPAILGAGIVGLYLVIDQS